MIFLKTNDARPSHICPLPAHALDAHRRGEWGGPCRSARGAGVAVFGRGKGGEFALLKPALTEPTASALNTAAVAEALGIPRDQVRVRVHRLRTRFREVLLERIAATLHTSRRDELEAEMQALLAALR